MRHERVRGADGEAKLAHALVAAAAIAGLGVGVEDHRSRPWSSATFTGAQHVLVLVAPRAPALGGWVASLPDAEVALRGHIVASLAVDRIVDDGATVRVTLAVLTIEDG